MLFIKDLFHKKIGIFNLKKDDTAIVHREEQLAPFSLFCFSLLYVPNLIQSYFITNKGKNFKEFRAASCMLSEGLI